MILQKIPSQYICSGEYRPILYYIYYMRLAKIFDPLKRDNKEKRKTG